MGHDEFEITEHDRRDANPQHGDRDECKITQPTGRVEQPDDDLIRLVVEPLDELGEVIDRVDRDYPDISLTATKEMMV